MLIEQEARWAPSPSYVRMDESSVPHPRGSEDGAPNQQGFSQQRGWGTHRRVRFASSHTAGLFSDFHF